MKLKIQEALKKAQKALEVGRMQEAQIIYRAILNAKPNHAVASHNLGIIAVGSNHIAVALDLFKTAVKSKPTVEQYWVSYLTTLIEADHIKEADKVFRLSELETLNSDMIQDCRLQLGIKLSNADRFEEAIKHLEAVGSKKAKMYILRCLYLMDDRTSFCDLLEHFVSEREINAMVGSLVSRSEIRYGLNVKNLFCKKPLNYLQTVDLTTQYDFQNLFTKPMETLLVQNRVPMRRQSLLSNGVQTAGNLFELGATPTAEIEKIIRVEIDNYLTKFRDSGEGFLKNWPSEYSLSGWLVSLRSGGELAPHIHEEGWLSGTIYINVPSDLEDDSGSLVVTMEEDKYLSAQSTGYKKVVEISTGTLVLFPASLLHYTIPFESKEQRIVLAFDVIPKKKTMLGV